MAVAADDCRGSGKQAHGGGRRGDRLRCCVSGTGQDVGAGDRVVGALEVVADTFDDD